MGSLERAETTPPGPLLPVLLLGVAGQVPPTPKNATTKGTAKFYHLFDTTDELAGCKVIDV